MSDFFKINDDIDDNKKRNQKIRNIVDNPILFSNSDNPELFFLIDEYLSEKQIKWFDNFIKHNIETANLKYQLIYCLKVLPLQTDLKSNIGDFFYEHCIDLKKYIPDWSKVLCIGRSLYSVTYGNTDISVEAFEDFIFNKTYFFSSQLKSYVFPVHYFNSWIGRDSFENFFIKRQLKVCKEYQVKPFRLPIVKCQIIDNPNEFLLNYMKDDPNGYLILDIETTGFDYIKDHPFSIQFCNDDINGYYLRWKDIDLNILNNFLKGKKLVNSNLKFDIKMIKYQFLKNGIKEKDIDLKIYDDLLNLGHILNEMRSNSEKSLSWYYTSFGGYERELNDYKKKYPKVKDYSQIPESIMYKYATMDVIVGYHVWKEMLKQLKWIDDNFKEEGKWSLEKYYRNIVIPAVNLFVQIEMDGVYFNWDGLEKLSTRVKGEIKEIQNKIRQELGLDFDLDTSSLDLENNIEIEKIQQVENFFNMNKESDISVDSNEQLAIRLEKLGWECLSRNKKGLYNVNDDNLQKWSKLEKSKKGAELILQLHRLNVLFNGFIGDPELKTGYFKFKNGVDNKLHSNFSVMLCDSGRNRSSNPNLQNFPERGYLAKELKSLFITKNENYLDYSCDFSGFQLVIGSILSNDKFMQETFKGDNPDLHSLTSYKTYKNLFPDKNITYEEVLKFKKQEPYKTYRQKSKSQNFQLEFGASAFNFAKTVIEPDWSIKDCEDYIEKNNLYKKRDNLLNLLYGRNSQGEEELDQEEKEKRNLIFSSIENKEIFSLYWACACDIRKKHFELYSGLKIWIDETIIKTKQLGYVKSVFGAFRRLPRLLYIGKDDKQTIIKNLSNISLNTGVQNFEISVIHLSMIEFDKWIKENNIDVSMYNMIHDSCKFYIHKDFEKISKSKIDEIFQQDRIEYKGIPVRIEGK